MRRKFDTKSWLSFEKAMEQIEKTMQSFDRDFESMNEGWKCPKCNNIYAPHIPMCMVCNHATKPEPNKNKTK